MMFASTLLYLLPLLSAGSAASDLANGHQQQPILRPNADLNPMCRPGGNFDLSAWQLQLPIAKNSKKEVLVVNPSELSPKPQSAACSSGYQDPDRQYFFTESGDGAMVMKAPGNPDLTHCVKFKESQHCRTELGEVQPWSSTNSVNRLTMTLLAVAGNYTCIGQVFQAHPNPNKPLAELYYGSDGVLHLGVAKKSSGGNQISFTLDKVPFGTKFSYELSFEKGLLGFSLNGGKRRIFEQYFSTPSAFFKAGNYNQEKSAVTSSIHVFALNIAHG